jgi:hypothetical protein
MEIKFGKMPTIFFPTFYLDIPFPSYITVHGHGFHSRELKLGSEVSRELASNWESADRAGIPIKII